MKTMLFCAELTDFKMILNVLRSIMFQDVMSFNLYMYFKFQPVYNCKYYF